MPDVYPRCLVFMQRCSAVQQLMTSKFSTTVMYQCVKPLIDTLQKLWPTSAAVIFTAAATSRVNSPQSLVLV